MANQFELLLALGIDTAESKNNIDNYINNIKKNLPDLELELNINGGQSSQDFRQLEQQISKLQSQVKQLNNELKGVDTGLSLDGLEKFKRDIGSSINSVEDLKKTVENFNGDLTLNFGKTKLPDGTSEDILRSVNATIRDVEGNIQSINFKPVIDSQGFVVGLEEISSKLKQVDFKDFDNKARKTNELLNELGRQGYISADDLDAFRNSLDNIRANKSVQELQKLEAQVTSLNKELSFDDRISNSFSNIERQAESLRNTLNKLSRSGNIDSNILGNLNQQVDSAASSNIGSVRDINAVNQEFKNLESTISRLVTESNELTKINTAIANISPSVDRLNNKLEITTNKLGNNIDADNLAKVRSEIEAIGSTEIKSVDDITRLNNQISQTEKAITQLSVAGNSLNRFDDSINKANLELDKLQKTGYATSDVIEDFKLALANVPTGDISRVKTILDEIKQASREIGEERSLRKFVDSSQAEVQKLLAQVEKVKSLYTGSYDRGEANTLANTIKDISNQIEQLRVKGANGISVTAKEYDNLNSMINATSQSVRNFNATATIAVRNAGSLGDALEQAFTKFPIWMLASTTFYGTIRGIQDLTEKVIELDTAMTNLIRVADGEQYQFDEVISRSIDNVTELSGRMEQYLELVTEYARTGKTIDESFDLANTTQLLTNISDLNAAESVDALTAAMISFNISAEDSVQIANKLNEVDNNFSVTTKILSDGMLKASATANTFGVELDFLLGNITAIASQTRETGSVVGNGLKTIYARIGNNQSSVNALQAIGISLEKTNGEVKTSQELIEELAQRWDGLSDAQRRATSIGVAGIYQLSRFNALMHNYEMSTRAAETATNSFGSAMRENEKYEQSLEARINRLNTAWYGLAEAIGNTVIYDTIVVATEAFTNLTEAADNQASSNLMLASTVGGVVGLLSTLFSGFNKTTGSIIQNTASQLANNAATNSGTTGLIAHTRASLAASIQTVRTSVATRGLTGSFYALAASATAAGTAIRTAISATGIGLVITGLTFGITALINKMSEATQENEEFEARIEKNVDALTVNKERVDELISSFESLGSISKKTAEQETEYLNVQNELAELFPALISHIDSSGQAHIKEGELIGAEIELVKELIEARKEEMKVKGQDVIEDSFSNVEKAKKDIKSYEKLIADTQKNLARAESGNPLYAFSDTDKYKKDIKQFEAEIIKLQLSVSNSTQEAIGSILQISDAFTDVEIDPNLNKEVEALIRNLNFENVDPSKLDEFASKLAKIRTELSNSLANGDQSGFNSANNDLIKLLATIDEGGAYNQRLALSFDDLKESTEDAANELTFADETMNEVGSSASELDKRIQDLSESMNDLKTVEEQLAGVSSKANAEGQALVYQYEVLTQRLGGLSDSQLRDLAQKQNLTAEEKVLATALKQREEVMTLLTTLYPELATLQGDAISLTHEQTQALKLEQNAYENIIKAYKLDAEGKLTSEQAKSLYAAQGVKDRIKTTEEEIASLGRLIDQYENSANAQLTAQEFVNKVLAGEHEAERYSLFIPGVTDKKAKQDLSNLKLDLSNYKKELGSYGNTLSNIIKEVESSSKKTSSTKAKSDKETTQSIYITDKFKQALEQVNLQIEKQNTLQSKYPTYSNSYKKALEAELKLQREKLKLIQNQESALRKQIQTGRIAQTGNVQVQSSKTVTTGGKTQSLLDSIKGGRISDTYGTVRGIRGGRVHTGVDIAAPKGTPLYANVGGKVTATGYNSLSGNFVKVKDDKGLSHFYGHLDKITTKIGQIVQIGSQLGNIGNTGNSTGPHLHYQIADKNGKTFNPINYVKNAQAATKQIETQATKTNGTIATTQQAIDEAKSTLVGLQGDALAQQEIISKLIEEIALQPLEMYERRRNVLDTELDYESAKLANVSKETSRYSKTIDNQVKLLERKKKVNDEEIAYINQLIAKGDLSVGTLNDLNQKTIELRTSTEQLNNQMSKIRFDAIIEKFDDYIQRQTDVIDYESAKINELDKNSERYGKTLEQINRHLNRQILTNQDLINSLQKTIDENKESAEVIEQAKRKVQELTVEMKTLAQEIASNNYEIVVNVKARYDEEIDDLQYGIDLSKLREARFEEGSIDATNEINKQIEAYQKIAQAQDKSRKALQAELKQRDLLPERIKEITELLEDETLAYESSINTITELNKKIEDTKNRLLNEIADDIIDTYKRVISARQEDHIKAIDDEIKREEDRHRIYIDQLNREADLFRKNIEERLRLLDREDATRSYNMEIDDLEKERNKLNDALNLLSIDTSSEAKSKRKKLQEQIDEVDKQINETRYKRDLDLQKQGLNDLLETREEDLSNREEIADKELQGTVDRLNRQKEYYNKYYEDLLNDERKFAQIREDVLNQNFDKIANEFAGYIDEMKATLPGLQDTLDGTMQAVGTSIRQNLIDQISKSIDKLKEFQALQVSTNPVFDNFNPNEQKDTSYQGNTKPSSGGGFDLGTHQSSTADKQVLFGKFLNDVIASGSNMQGIERQNVKNVAYEFAAQGRNSGSVIPENIGFQQYIKGVNAAEKSSLLNFFKNNADVLGSKYTSKVKNSIASLNTGGLVNSSGSGIDGIGGKFGILHPDEVVLDAIDTDKLFKNIEVSDNIARSLASMSHTFNNILTNAIPNFSNPSVATGGDTYQFTFGNVYGTGQAQVRTFANEIMDEIRTTKGGQR